MTNRVLQLVSIFVILLFTGFSSAQSTPSAGTLTGTVFCRQRIALPHTALVEVDLLDATLADAPAKLLGQVKIPTEGRQVPIPFKLEFQPADIQFSRRYQVRAKITAGGNLLFASTQVYPAFVNRQPAIDLAIMVEQVQAGPRGQSSLEDTDWKLIELHGEPIVNSGGVSEAYIVLHSVAKNFTGNGGCNRLMGSFTKEGQTLRFRVVGSTMMACPDAQMKQEQAFTKALVTATRFHIAGGYLELSDGRQIVARFQAQSIK